MIHLRYRKQRGPSEIPPSDEPLAQQKASSVMRKSNSTIKAARRMQPVDLGNGKAYTPIRTEFGHMEYELSFHGELVGIATSPEQARETLNEVAYDFERGTIPAAFDLEPDPTEQAVEVAANAIPDDVVTVGRCEEPELVVRHGSIEG